MKRRGGARLLKKGSTKDYPGRASANVNSLSHPARRPLLREAQGRTKFRRRPRHHSNAAAPRLSSVRGGADRPAPHH